MPGRKQDGAGVRLFQGGGPLKRAVALSVAIIVLLLLAVGASEFEGAVAAAGSGTFMLDRVPVETRTRAFADGVVACETWRLALATMEYEMADAGRL